MAQCSTNPTLTLAELLAALQAEVAAGHGAHKLLVEGPLTLFEVSGVRIEPEAERVWLETSWCHTQPKAPAL